MYRQPVHTLYGGAHLFRRDTVPKMGLLASRQLLGVAPDCFSFAEALGLPEAAEFPRTDNGKMSLLRRFQRKGKAAQRVHPPAWFAFALYQRVLAKLRSEPVEDFRIDFEDGYGFRGNREEDEDAVRAATETALAQSSDALPPFFGIRIKPLTSEFRERALRTLELFMKKLLDASSGKLPSGFVVTLPKVSASAEVDALAAALAGIERTHALPPGAIQMELMVEHPRVLTADGHGTVLLRMIAQGAGRVRGLHLGLYDYLSSLGVVSSMQEFRHPSADHLRSATSVIAAVVNVWKSDGAVNIIPVAPHHGEKISRAQQAENERAVRDGWRELFGHVTHSLRFGYYQGWDLHPAQMIPRYAAVFALFLREYDKAAGKLRSFLGGSARAKLDGQDFDDIATGLGLLQFFSRGLSCGAFSEDDIRRTGLAPDEAAAGSFSKIIGGRSGRAESSEAPEGLA